MAEGNRFRVDWEDIKVKVAALADEKESFLIVRDDFTASEKVRNVFEGWFSSSPQAKHLDCTELLNFISLSPACKKDISKEYRYECRTLSLIISLLIHRQFENDTSFAESFQVFKRRFHAVFQSAHRETAAIQELAKWFSNTNRKKVKPLEELDWLFIQDTYMNLCRCRKIVEGRSEYNKVCFLAAAAYLAGYKKKMTLRSGGLTKEMKRLHLIYHFVTGTQVELRNVVKGEHQESDAKAAKKKPRTAASRTSQQSTEVSSPNLAVNYSQELAQVPIPSEDGGANHSTRDELDDLLDDDDFLLGLGDFSDESSCSTSAQKEPSSEFEQNLPSSSNQAVSPSVDTADTEPSQDLGKRERTHEGNPKPQSPEGRRKRKKITNPNLYINELVKLLNEVPLDEE